MDRRGHLRIEIKDSDDYSCICCDMIDDFADELMQMEGMTKEPHEFDYEATEFIWTFKACNLIDRYIKRTVKIGEKHFDKSEIDIGCTRIIEL